MPTSHTARAGKARRKTPHTPAAKASTNWTALRAQTDADIRAAAAADPDAAPILTPDWFATAQLVMPGKKRAISIRLDDDIVTYFQSLGGKYQQRINAVLRAFVRMQHATGFPTSPTLNATTRRRPKSGTARSTAT